MRETFGVMRQGPNIETVFNELVACIQADDWSKYSTSQGEDFYHIMGFKSHVAQLEGHLDLEVSEFPLPAKAGPVSEWFITSQVAGRHADYLQRSRKQLEKIGVDSSLIDEALNADPELAVEVLTKLFKQAVDKGDTDCVLMTQFLQAFRIWRAREKKQAIDLDRDDKDEAENVRGKLYLRELVEKFGKMMTLGPSLEVLSFQDSQLEEASRTCLYGFHRAAVILSACALERQLKRKLSVDRFERYEELTEKARWSGLLDADLVKAAKLVFRKPNKVVHENLTPSGHEAIEALDLARKVVAHLRVGD